MWAQNINQAAYISRQDAVPARGLFKLQKDPSKRETLWMPGLISITSIGSGASGLGGVLSAKQSIIG